jgi:Ni,Fe-hydrogenase III large subunit
MTAQALALALLRAAPVVACAPYPRHVLAQEAWAQFAAALAHTPRLDLLALWADTTHVHVLFHDSEDATILPASVAVESGLYPALSPARPGAAWFERMIRDLWGHTAADGLDQRPWLDHGHWPATPPLATRPLPNLAAAEPAEFLAAEGEGLHQIAVGPVHAGIIEPGHFRFTCNGETVVRLEIRLGYLHKGTLGLLRGKSPRAAARFAARLSGDSTVAHAIAFAHAAEAACGVAAPPRAASLRAVMGEIERIANHLGDVGAIVNDASFALLQSRFVWQREAMLRAAARAFGHRLMMDAVIPGGVAEDLAPGGDAAILGTLDGIEAELPVLVQVYEDTSSLVDRMQGTGTLSADLAARFAAGGVIGRASAGGFDARRIPGYRPYDRLDVIRARQDGGDVDARVRVRLAEITESIRLLRLLLTALPDGPIALPLPMASGEGIGWAEGFRGDIWHWLRLEGGLITAAFLADPSWRQWPLLEAAIAGNIVADFPLCNKSFNCSYSGVDL